MKANDTGTQRKNAEGTGASTPGISPEKPKATYSKGGHWVPTIPGQVCEECGSTFTARKRDQRFCGKSCSTKATARKRFANVERTERTCPACEVVWTAPASNSSLFCSKACLEARWREGRKRTCIVCDIEFYAPRSGRASMTCSPECLRQRQSEIASGREVSDETKAKMSAALTAKFAEPEFKERWAEANAKAIREWHSDPANAAEFAQRSSERMKRRHADPEWQRVRDERSSRVMKENWEKYREIYIAASVERYRRGIGIASDEAVENKTRANRWIMKRAQEALHSETDYDATYAEVQARIRREQPFNGPDEDYYDYLKWLGREVVNSPECRQIADSFLSKAIPRFSVEWREHKADAPNP